MPIVGHASHHEELAQLRGHHKLVCARLDTEMDVNKARLRWLSLCLARLVMRNADSSEMASSGMVAPRAVGRDKPTPSENGC